MHHFATWWIAMLHFNDYSIAEAFWAIFTLVNLRIQIFEARSKQQNTLWKSFFSLNSIVFNVRQSLVSTRVISGNHGGRGGEAIFPTALWSKCSLVIAKLLMLLGPFYHPVWIQMTSACCSAFLAQQITPQSFRVSNCILALWRRLCRKC